MEAVDRTLALVAGSGLKLLDMEAGLLAAKIGVQSDSVSRAKHTLNALEHALGSGGLRSRWIG